MCRVSFDAGFFQALETVTVEPVAFEIGAVELVRSELMPDGSRHTVLGTAAFND